MFQLRKNASLYVEDVLMDIVSEAVRNVVDSSQDAVVCFDEYGKCIYVNQKATEFVEGDNVIEKLEQYYEEWIQHARMNGGKSGSWKQMYVFHNTPRYFVIEYHFNKEDSDRKMSCSFLISDRTMFVENFKKEHYRLTHDALTDLYNRMYFFETAKAHLKESPNQEFYMICSNIKEFKLYNELFGEEKGNEVLRLEADLLRKADKCDAVYGRLGGDEFAIMMNVKDYNENAILDTVKYMSEKWCDEFYHLYVKVGVYRIKDKNENVSSMCDRALLALQNIRQDYNKALAYYEGEMLNVTLKERRIVSEFDKALEEGQFCVYLQPQVSVNGEIKGAEALVRWYHPELGLVSPADFIPVLENTGLIYRLDMFVWELAAKKLKSWKEEGKGELYLSVNISVKDFYYIDIYEVFKELAEKYDIHPGNLKLEITETVMLNKQDYQMEMLRKLREYGFIVEMDDFGSGYSSLNMLKDVELDVIKIDMEFLKETVRTERSRIILNMIIGLIDSLGMESIMEGVETYEQVQYLRDMGCKFFQGYYFSRPIPINEFEKKYLEKTGVSCEKQNLSIDN